MIKATKSAKRFFRNAEEMLNEEGKPKTAHTTNKVPFVMANVKKAFSVTLLLPFWNPWVSLYQIPWMALACCKSLRHLRETERKQCHLNAQKLVLKIEITGLDSAVYGI